MITKLLDLVAGVRKAMVAVGNALVVTGTALSDGAVSQTEWTLIGAAWATAWGVFWVTNRVGAVERKR